MLNTDYRNAFCASWNEQNAKLNPNRGGCCEKTLRKIKKCLFFIPDCLVATCINPRSESPFISEFNIGRKNSRLFAKEIITPDNTRLSAFVHVVKGADANTPTVLLFNPLGTNESVHEELKSSLHKKKCNVVTFNYRGLGTTRSAEDLVIDGDSVYQYVTQELGTNKDKVHFYGFSLGGALAAQVKALHPESTGKYVGDRPFKSIYSLIEENCCISCLGAIVKKITSFISAILLAYPLYLLGWEWDGDKALSQLQGEKRVIYHPNDCLIPFEASLAGQCEPDQRICLNPTETGPSTHFASIEYHTTLENQEALSVVVNFLAQ